MGSILFKRHTNVQSMSTKSTTDFLNLGRMDSLRQKLENQGLRDVVYMVVNHQGAQARGLHAMLAQRLSEHISLHRQDEALADVWQTLGGNKDDFFIYDRFVTHQGEHHFNFVSLIVPLQSFPTGVDVSLTEFPFPTPLSGTATWRKRSKTPTAVLSVASVHMRYEPQPVTFN